HDVDTAAIVVGYGLPFDPGRRVEDGSRIADFEMRLVVPGAGDCGTERQCQKSGPSEHFPVLSRHSGLDQTQTGAHPCYLRWDAPEFKCAWGDYQKESIMDSLNTLARLAAGRTDLVLELLQQQDAAALPLADNTPVIQWCAYYGDVTALRALLARGASL